MIKANGTNRDGTPVVVIGLSHLDMVKLQSGQPIVIKQDESGLNYDMTLLAGASDEALMELFQISKK